MAAILNFGRISKKKVAQMLFVINTVPIAKTELKSVHKYSSYRWPNKQTNTQTDILYPFIYSRDRDRD